MTLSIANVTIDCHDPGKLADFYAQLLGHPVDPDASEFYSTVGRSSGMTTPLMFIRVPDKTPGKNVVHLDLATRQWREEIERAVSLGARHIADYDEYGIKWATLADPEGNLFDIGDHD
ncbi:VOC family protein [Nocardia cyriacigeorgica]|uniref:VOC family protein n=2 Tax=Nocardia cyriacigeorgica TaxID=135487 RepID=UPI0013D6535B|nr:VOC family protein [Nocardia cyriacigeorgica]MBF6438099.1 VOC family protein [Nocardia cyriacigeorgica]MBF6453635.1 VOC family protein [Nocardia cyriacigeorgica]MBF6550803.1 VOC family protein [Nocardia cyriacigeorgica]NEW29965.1 VOC family protein [Nocardia cyriacigeorgica]